MSQWLQSAKATVSAGAEVISFTDNQDFSSVRAGDVVMVNGQIWQCASGTRPDSAGKSTVTLAAPWPYTGASNVNAFVFRTTHDLLQLTSDARKLTNITKALLAAQEDILKGTTPTINVPIGLDPATGNEEVFQVTPWQYVINVVNASLGNISAIAAMSQAQFEAIRAQNKELYAASGFVHFGRHISDGYWKAVNQGIWVSGTESSKTIRLGTKTSNAIGLSKTELPLVNIAGIIFSDLLFNEGVGQPWSNVKFPQAPDGKTTYNKSTGVITNHDTVTAAFNAQAADPTNVEVVTDRPDMWGLEAWLEEVSVTNPHIYPNGLPQSQATTMDGITTSASARPVTYYAVFDGDTGSKGRGLNFFALTDAQKKKVLANPKNNLYYLDDGRLVQWRLRQRTIAGAGNGDWRTIDSIYSDGIFGTNNNTRFLAQGMSDSITSIGNDGVGIGFLGYAHSAKTLNQDVGLFSGRHQSLSAISGECYFLVCGTVNRLNQGAYHPSFNPLGAAKFVGDTFWYNTATSITSKADCFDSAKLLAGSGSIASGKSGRPEIGGRYYDAIYADGFGGVCRDMRYSAYGVGSVDFAEADQRVKNGTYRGFEKVVFTKIVPETYPADPSSGNFIYAPELFKGDPLGNVALHIGGLFHKESNGVIYSSRILAMEGAGDQLYVLTESPMPRGASTLTVIPVKTVASVGGSFLQTDVIGSPANILATPQLANGWWGSWVSNEGIRWAMSRKAVTATGLQTYTSNNGGSWASTTVNIEAASNDVPAGAANLVWIAQYQAFAKQTEPAQNAVLAGLVPYNVFASSDYRPENGALLGESLIGKVLKNNSGVTVNNKSLLSCAIDSAGKLTSAANFDGITHQALTLGAPANNSPAFKLVSYLANINQQAVPHFAYTELRHNGTSFGDDVKQTIVDNQSTKPNYHGVTVVVGTAQLREHIGWFKNKV